MKKNNFKHVESDYDAPEAIKDELTTSLGFFRNAGRIFDLYLGKIAWIFSGLLRGNHLDDDQNRRGHNDFGEPDPPDHQLDHDSNNSRGF